MKPPEPGKKPKPARRAQAGAAPAKPRKSRKEQAAETKERLKLATLAILERVGYRQMRIVDIAKEAGVAVGLFYHYFPDIKSITCEVLSDFMSAMTVDARQSPRGDDLFQTLRAQYLILVRHFDKHPGLMRCMIQVSDEIPEFGEIWEQANRKWTNSFARYLEKCMGGKRPSADVAVLMAYSLGSMADAMMYEYYVRKNPDLLSRVKSQEHLAKILAALTYRAVFLKNPDMGLPDENEWRGWDKG